MVVALLFMGAGYLSRLLAQLLLTICHIFLVIMEESVRDGHLVTPGVMGGRRGFRVHG